MIQNLQKVVSTYLKSLSITNEGILTSSLSKFSKLVGFVFLILSSSQNLVAQNGCLNAGDAHNTPCTSCLYDFGGSNVVPCGPSANTTSSVPINHGNGDGGYTVPGGCGAICPAPDNDVLWVSFQINTGGSFEWQTVAGADKFYWVMYYSTNQPPDDGSSNTNDAGDCAEANLVFYKCGTQFTGWETETTPDPSKTWRYYIAYFFQGTDKDKIADGVVKIRKSCGLACGEPAATTATASSSCIETGSTTLVTLSPGTVGVSYFWSATPADASLDGQEQVQNPVVSPSATTTYFVTVVGSDGCPLAVGEVIVEVNSSCFECLADAGAISGFSSDEILCLGETSLDLISFSTDAAAQVGYSNAFFLVDETGAITDVTGGTSTTFLFSGKTAGMYSIYGLSYLDSQAATDAADYVDNFGTLAALQADILPSGTTCAALAAHNFTLSIVDPSCGTFPQN